MVITSSPAASIDFRFEGAGVGQQLEPEAGDRLDAAWEMGSE
jgi:hypothetical protein